MTGSAQPPQNPFFQASAPPLYPQPQPSLQGQFDGNYPSFPPPPPYDTSWAPQQQQTEPPQPAYYQQANTASSAHYAESTARNSAGSTNRAARRIFSWPAAISTGLITLGVTYALDVRNPRALIISILVGTFFGFLGPRERTVRVVERFNPGFHFTQNWGVYYAPTQSNYSSRTVFIGDWRPPFVDRLSFSSFFRTAYSAPSNPSSSPRAVHVGRGGQASTRSAPLSVSGLRSDYVLGSSNPPLGAAVPSGSSSKYQTPRAGVDVRGGPSSPSTYPPVRQHAAESPRSASSPPPLGRFASSAAAKQDQ